MSREVELALKKQHLRYKSAALRAALVDDCMALSPTFNTIDRIGAGVGWVRRHPQVLVGLAVALVVARPRAVLRWARRGFFAWQAVRRLRGVSARTPFSGGGSGNW